VHQQRQENKKNLENNLFLLFRNSNSPTIGSQQSEKFDWQEPRKFIVVPRQFSQVVGEWRENQI